MIELGGIKQGWKEQTLGDSPVHTGKIKKICSILEKGSIMKNVRVVKLSVFVVLFVVFLSAEVYGQRSKFNGLNMGMGNLSRLSHAKTRSISAENFTSEKGKGGMATEGAGARAARDLGQGWKVSPCVDIETGETFVLADIERRGGREEPPIEGLQKHQQEERPTHHDRVVHLIR